MPVGRGLTNDADNWSINVEWLRQDSAGVNIGSVRQPGPAPERTVFNQVNFVLRGPIAENWTMSVLVPRVEIQKRTRATGDLLNLQGLGDAVVYAEYGDNDLRWLMGLKLPTGDEAEAPAPGLVPPSLLQLGTGTIDPLFGVIWDGGDGEGFEPYADFTAMLPFEDSDAGLQPGQTFTGRAGGYWQNSTPFTPGVQLEMVRREEDRLSGAYLDNTGGTLWTLVPSVQFPLGGGASARLSLRLPLEQDVSGTQLVPGQGVVLEAGWVF